MKPVLEIENRIKPNLKNTNRLSPRLWAIMRHCVHDPTFSHFIRTSACDRETGTWPWHIQR